MRLFARGLALLAALAWATAAVARAPERIVSLAPHITALLFEAGLGPRVVGVTESCPSVVEETRQRAKVASHLGANIEAILALEPDVVVAWPSGNRAADLETLRRQGIRIETSEPRTFEQILADFERFAAWAGPEPLERARRRSAELRRLLIRLKARSAEQPRLRVFYHLGGERLWTLSNVHLVGEALALCGADNLFGHLRQPAAEVSREAIVAARPQLILVAEPDAAAVKRFWQRLAPSVPVLAFDGSALHRPSLASFSTLEALCEALAHVRRRG